MTFLTADAGNYADPNENSVVVRLNLGPDRLLFMGDAEASDDRQPPSVPPRPDFAEGQLLSCCLADIRADLYSLGCSMYHLITGRHAFPGDSPIERLGKRINGRPVPITDVRIDMPPIASGRSQSRLVGNAFARSITATAVTA